jgi:hypothetical protein
LYHGVAWRYTTNGFFPISEYGQIKTFNALGEDYAGNLTPSDFFPGIFDRKYNTYILTIKPSRFSQVTYGFEEGDQATDGWKSKYSFVPNVYGICDNTLVSFVDDEMWLHDSDSVDACNFYGTQYDWYVKFASNAGPKTLKMFKNIRVHCNTKVEAPNNGDVLIKASGAYPSGMQSRLKGGRWLNYEGVWCADFLNDILDPEASSADDALMNGRNLRGEIIIVKLYAVDPTSVAQLFAVDIESFASMKTN